MIACHAITPSMGNRLKELRLLKGLSRDGLANLVGTSKGQIWKLENGERRLSDVWLERLAPVLNVGAGEILGDKIEGLETQTLVNGMSAEIMTFKDSTTDEDQAPSGLYVVYRINNEFRLGQLVLIGDQTAITEILSIGEKGATLGYNPLGPAWYNGEVSVDGQTSNCDIIGSVHSLRP